MYFPDKTDAEVKVSKIAGAKLKTGDDKGKSAQQDVAKLTLVTYSKLSDGTYDVRLFLTATRLVLICTSSLLTPILRTTQSL